VSSEYVKRIYYSTTYVINAPIYRQFPQLPRGCEVTSLSMLVNYVGKHLDKMTLSYQIHKVTYWIGRYHSNPHDGFVGICIHTANLAMALLTASFFMNLF
jgi:uncharacterized protein YvpB